MLPYIVDAIVILSLIFANAILAMTELAIISSNRTKMENLAEKHQGAKVALELMKNPNSFLSTIQVGITMIGIISGAFTGHQFAEPLGDWLNKISWLHGHGDLIAFSAVVLIIAYMTIVLGELVPKNIGIAHPEKVASLIARPVRLLSKIAYPFVVILDWSTRVVLNIFNQKNIKKAVLTEEEIHAVLKQGFNEGVIDAFEHTLFRKVFQFGGRQASVIMTPRQNMIYLNIAESNKENTKKILESNHRYYPVFEGVDNFKGIIDTKDILKQQMLSQALNLSVLIKEVPCIKHADLGPHIIEQFKKYNTHIAIVNDDFGVILGIITLVDLFEAIVDSIPLLLQDEN